MGKKMKYIVIGFLGTTILIGLLLFVFFSLVGSNEPSGEGMRAARISAAISQVRSYAELVYNDDNLSYATLCSGNLLNSTHAVYGTELGSLSNQIDVNNQTIGGPPICYSSGNQYCFSATFQQEGNIRNICVTEAGVIGDDACEVATSTCN